MGPRLRFYAGSFNFDSVIAAKTGIQRAGVTDLYTVATVQRDSRWCRLHAILSIPAITGEEKTSSRNWPRFPAELGIAKRQGSG